MYDPKEFSDNCKVVPPPLPQRTFLSQGRARARGSEWAVDANKVWSVLVEPLPQRVQNRRGAKVADVWIEDCTGFWLGISGSGLTPEVTFSQSHVHKCGICTGCSSSLSSQEELVKLHDDVLLSGRFNFEGLRIPVASNLCMDKWRFYLNDFHDSNVVEWLEFGWPIGCRFSGVSVPKCSYFNHRGAREFPVQVEGYLAKEVSEGHILGPFKADPFGGSLITSPLNTVPKRDSDDRRIILDLSFPRGCSINDSVPKDSYLGVPSRLHFPSVDALVELVKDKGPGCMLFKRDLRKAYRQIPVDPHDYHLLGYSWRGHYFCDTVLPMGLRSSCQACQRVTRGVVHAFAKMGYSMVNYIDDLAGAETVDLAGGAFLALGQLLQELGLEESPSKASAPSTVMSFLGVQFDTVARTLSVTRERLEEILDLLSHWLGKVTATRKEVQSLLGKLNFVASCVRPGRVFIARMLQFLRGMQDGVPKVLSQEFRKDVLWWQRFLPLYNGVSMMAWEDWGDPDVVLATDACLTGYGAFSLGKYCHGVFPLFLTEAGHHINVLELLVIMVSVKLWGSSWKGLRIQVFCDNSSSVAVLNSGLSRDSFMQACLREISFYAALFGFELRAVHLPGVLNRVPDLLSRWSLRTQFREEFFRITSAYKLQHYIVPDELFTFTHDW